MLLEFYISEYVVKSLDIDFAEDIESLDIDICYNDGFRDIDCTINIPSLETIKGAFNNIDVFAIKKIFSYIDINIKTDEGEYQSKRCLMDKKFDNTISFDVEFSNVPVFHMRLVNEIEIIERDDVERSFYIFIP